MPPQLALILCSIFVFWLLRVEGERAPEVSRVLWIPTIWMLNISSKPLAYWFGVYGEVGEGSPLDRAFLIVLFFIGVLLLIRRKFVLISAIKANPWLVLLLGYMLLSVMWSEIPGISFKRWIRELIAVVMAFIVLTERNPKEAMESILRRSAYILIPFSLLLIKYFPYLGIEFARWSGVRMWIGVTMQKNGLGRLCLITAFFLVWSLIKKWQMRDSHIFKHQTYADFIILILTFYLLTGGLFLNSYSATAIAALAAGLTVFIILLWFKKLRVNIGTNTIRVIMLFLIVFGIVTMFVGGSTISKFSSTLGREETLTGRAEVWSSLLPIAMQRPILGRGVGGFWTANTRVIYNISEGHSGYLDVLLDLGFVGILIVSMFLLSSCSRASKELMRDFYWNSLWICYLFMAVIHNITESSLNSMTSQLTATLVFIAVASTVFVRQTQE